MLPIHVGTVMVALLLVGLLVLVALIVDEDAASLLVTATMSLGRVPLLVAVGAAWVWFFRDGLGPGFIPSEGPEAVRRFLQGYWPALVVGLAEALVVTVACRRRLNTPRQRLAAS